jgi:hypothetical protein
MKSCMLIVLLIGILLAYGPEVGQIQAQERARVQTWTIYYREWEGAGPYRGSLKVAGDTLRQLDENTLVIDGVMLKIHGCGIDKITTGP